MWRGARPPGSVLALAAPLIRVLGDVADPLPLYSAARVFIAPTREAAGIPYKIHHAAAHRLPVVATRLLAEQLGCYRVQLTSNVRREDAHRFYERLGFSPTHVGFKMLLE